MLLNMDEHRNSIRKNIKIIELFVNYNEYTVFIQFTLKSLDKWFLLDLYLHLKKIAQQGRVLTENIFTL